MIDYDEFDDEEPTQSTLIPMPVDDDPTAPIEFETLAETATRWRKEQEAAQCEWTIN